jgi:hypothetical protein
VPALRRCSSALINKLSRADFFRDKEASLLLLESKRSKAPCSLYQQAEKSCAKNPEFQGKI